MSARFGLEVLHLQLIGALALKIDGTTVSLPSSGRARALLVWLALHPGMQPRSTIAAQFWPEVLDSSARSSLRTTLRTLRQELGSGAAKHVVGSRDEVGLAELRTDLLEFDELLAAGREAEAAELGLRGDLAPGIEDEWIDSARAEHRERMIALVGRLAGAAEAAGDHAGAVAWTRREVALDPLTERAHRDLIRRLVQGGDRAAALATYERLRETLRTQLSVAPSPQTRALVEAVRINKSEAKAPDIKTLLFAENLDASGRPCPLGDELPNPAAVERSAAMRAVVRGRGGRELGPVSDGIMAAFSNAREAVACAIELERSASRGRPGPEAAVAMRAGLHVGQPISDTPREAYGSVVAIARRLCAKALGGQILASTEVRDLCAESGEHRFGEAFEIALDGLVATQPCCEVQWEPRVRPPALLPSSFARQPTSPFVGRDAELARLKAAFQEALAGGLRVLFVAGEPGIGKTRLMRELCVVAHAGGAEIALGRCYEESVVPFQAFVEALRRTLAATSDSALADLARTCKLDELVSMVPELAQRLPEHPIPKPADSGEGRFRLFESVASLLSEIAGRAGAVLVLDDLQWADRPTLALLRHILRTWKSAPLLVLGTYRTLEVGDADPLTAMLAELRSDPERHAEVIELGGLDARDVEQLMSGWAGRPAPPSLARGFCRDTEGNPFFAEEVLRHLNESGRLFQSDGSWISERGAQAAGMPQGVKDVIGRRVARLGPEARETLGLAAVIGRRFSLDVLAKVANSSRDELVMRLDEAHSAGAIVEQPGAFGRYMFAHALVRETLYERLSTTRRVQLHLRVAEAIEELSPDDRGPVLGLLAYHFGRAIPTGGRERAYDYAMRAASHASTAFAYEHAVINYRGALDALDDHDDYRRCELMMLLGDAQIRAGDAAGAHATLPRRLTGLARSDRAPYSLKPCSA